MRRFRYTGFTIVELLVVVVVIGVLASIVTLGYTGITQRANNAQTISAVTSHIKALQQYATDFNSWPANIPSYPCIGDSYSATADFNANQCGQALGTCVNPGPSCATTSLTAYNSAIRPYFGGGNISMPSLQAVTYNGTTYRGAWARASTTTSSLAIRYWLSGNVSCETPAGSAAQKSYSDSNSTICTVTLPALQ